ncbi:MAG: glycosyltransferase family 4 protein [Acidobacteria bacterium]|nr:glycosyltransferase family 4 protein [Acidobacteriota bacterium]
MAERAEEAALRGRCLLVADSLAGGLGAAVRAQAAWMSEAGWRVLVAAPDARACSDPKGSESAPVAVPGTARNLRGMSAATVTLHRIARRFQPDVVHCHGLRSFAAARLAGIRAFLTVHGYGSMADDPPGYRVARAVGADLAARSALGAFSATPELGGYWTFLPHASPRLSGLTAMPFPREDIPTFLWLGRLDVPKRPDLFIRAVASVARRRPSRGVIAGSGPLEPGLHDLAELLSAPVTFVGGDGDVARLIGESWAVVLFSRHEALSFAVQEAMWAGRTVVASRLPGLEWLVGGSGSLVSTEEQAARALEALTNAATAREMGRSAAARVRRLLEPGEPWRTIEEVYRSRCAR